MVDVSFSPTAAIARLPRVGRIFVSGASGESQLFAQAIMSSGSMFASSFTGIFVPGINRTTYLPNANCRVETFFMTPELSTHKDQVDFLPLCYQDISRYVRATPFDAAIMMVSPPDTRGRCSFGPAVDFIAEIWPKIPCRIAHVNPLMPHTTGADIPFEAFDAVFARADPILASEPEEPDTAALQIASYVAGLIPNGATIQTGVGKIPSAILGALTGHRNLRIYSGFISDRVVDLETAGALARDRAVTCGVAIGSQYLYQAITRPIYRFAPASVTHNARLIAAIPKFVSINSALEVDLFGQAYAEISLKGASSGPGGASDFARAARCSEGGIRIVAMHADAKQGTISKIVVPGTARGPVSLGRFDIDFVVTQYGVADLRNLGHEARARALIAIASPKHRTALETAWSLYATAI
jgi:acyl-CoA hydrolase